MTHRRKRNRKRSIRRAIYCPIHHCYLDSVSRRYPLYADRAEQLQQRGMGRLNALTLVKTHTAVPIAGEWLEAFWCQECQEKTWYHVKRHDPKASHIRARFEVRRAPEELWQQVSGVIYPNGNPSVGEFTRKSARMKNYQGVKGFRHL